MLHFCEECGSEFVAYRTFKRTKCLCTTCTGKKKQAELIFYKGGRCEICGYDISPAALSFHHLDPTKKDFRMAGSATRSIASLKREADKCMLVCANCHAELHDEIGRRKIDGILNTGRPRVNDHSYSPAAIEKLNAKARAITHCKGDHGGDVKEPPEKK